VIRLSVLACFVFLYCCAYSQEDVEGTVVTPSAHTSRDSIRTHHIIRYDDQFFIWPVLKQRRLDFEIRDKNRQALSYRTNRPFSLGLGMYVFEVALEFAVAIPLDEQSKYIFGESRARDFQANALGKRWGLEAYHQKYTGFYIEHSSQVIAPGMPYPQRPDIACRNLGVLGNYMFNHQKFSFGSAYNFGERQLQSAGSFLLFSSLNSFLVQGDSSILSGRYTNTFNSSSHITRLRSTVLGLAPGYTYSLIYHGFFLNGTLALGPAHNWLMYHPEGGNARNDIHFSQVNVVRIALGYNGDRIFGGLSFVNQGRNAHFENLRLSSTNSSFRVVVGYRFTETGVLKKRFWDLPQALLN
jgi:hypothetical protein